MKRNRWFLEVVQDFDGSYYANMAIEGKPVKGLPEHVDYNTLREAIRAKTGIEILKRKEMKFQQSGRKSYAYIDATQYRKDCRVTLHEIHHGWRPDFEREQDTALTKIKFIKQPETFGCKVEGEVYQQLGPFQWAKRDWNRDGDVYAQKVAKFQKATNVNEHANDYFWVSEHDFTDLRSTGCIEYLKQDHTGQRLDDLIAGAEQIQSANSQAAAPQSEPVVSVAHFAQRNDIKNAVLQSDALRKQTLDLCYSIPGYSALPREDANRLYDLIKKSISISQSKDRASGPER